MRLKEIEVILNNINFKDVRLSYSNGTLSNINNFKIFMGIVEQIDIYTEDITEIKNSDLYLTTHDELTLSNQNAYHIFQHSKFLTDSAEALQLVFKKLLPQSNKNSITIKLPEPSDFESLIKTMSTFQKAISLIVTNKTINGDIKINHWEFGSFWFELILGTPAAVTLISSTVWAAAVISKKFTENKILEQHIRGMEIKNDSLTDILEKQKELTNQLVENEAQSVYDEHFKGKNNEQLERIKSTIKIFAKLIQDGAEIHPSLNAPEKVQNLFPNYQKLEEITSKIKLIEDKSGDETKED